MIEVFKHEGTVSHGTLRPEDLAPRFEGVLRELNPKLLRRLQDEKSDDLQEYVVGLMDALDMEAPEGYVFGTHEGDGSDFGFWDVRDRCDAFSLARQGLCNRVLDEHGQCDRAGDHRE